MLIFLLGFAIYITIAMMPLFYQEVLGYTALTAGMVVAPRGLGSMLGLPLMGFISHRIDNRWLITIGFTGFGLLSIWFSLINTGIGPTTMLIPIVLTGFALSFVFVPIGNMATVTLTNQQMGNATGIFNLLRNIGGSIGISLASTMLVRRMAFHQTAHLRHGAAHWRLVPAAHGSHGRVLRAPARPGPGPTRRTRCHVHAARAPGPPLGLHRRLPLDRRGLLRRRPRRLVLPSHQPR